MAPSKQQRDPNKTAAKEFQDSNSTTAAFLGGKQKSWMRRDHDFFPRESEASRETLHPISTLPRTNDQRSEVPPAVERKPQESDQIAVNSHGSAMSISPGFDRGYFPAQRRKARVEEGVTRGSSARSLSESSPASPPPVSNHQTTESVRSSVTREHRSSTALLSPVPSEEIPREGVEVINAVRQQPQALESSPRRRGRPRGSRNFTSSGSSSQKRAQDAANNPRKRIECCPPAHSSNVQPSMYSVESNKQNERFKTPLSNPELQHFASALVRRTQQVSIATGRGDYEIPRLGLLQDACARADYSYLIIHQMFCLKDLCNSLANDSPAPRVTPKHENGLKILGNFLAFNDGLCRDALNWFSVFPEPLLSLLLTDLSRPRFSRAYENVLKFLAKLSDQWNKIHATCNDRRFPPLVSEMLFELELESVILQQVISRAVLRDLLVGQPDPCCLLGDEVFTRDQQWVMHTQRLSQSSMASAAQTAEMAYHNQSVMHEYQQILASHAKQNHTLQSGPLRQAISNTPDNGNTSTGPPNQRLSVRSPENSGRYLLGSSCGYTPSSSNLNAQESRQMQFAAQSTPTTSSALFTDPQSAPIAGGSRPVYPIPRHLPHQLQATNGFFPPQATSINQGPVSPDRLASPGSNTAPSTQVPVQQRLRDQSTRGSFGSIPNQHLSSPTNMTQMNIGTLHGRHVLPSNAPLLNVDPLRSQPEVVRPLGAGTNHGQQTIRSEGTAQYPPQVGGHRSNLFMQFFQYPHQALPTQLGESRPQVSSSDGFIRLPSPNSGFLLPAVPNPAMTAIHQADARSPELSSANLRQSDGITKYFRFIQHVFMPTEVLSRDNCHQSQKSFLDNRDTQLLATDTTGQLGGPNIRKISNKSRLCRIRCLKLMENKGLPSPSEWAITDNTWPRRIAVVLNGIGLEIRRRSHHGKDFPIDVTSYIKSGGNELFIAIMGALEGANEQYAVGLEIIQVIDYASLKAGIPTLDNVEAQKRILDQSSYIDPDVQVVRPQMVLDITDPFTSRIFDIPVRGKFCRHTQCFDLDVFLETRGSKDTHQPCSPDEFRCPICKGDVRPQSLVIDGFFASIRAELDKQDRLDAKAIILQENGEWSIREDEEVKGETGDGLGSRTKSRLQNRDLSTARGGNTPARIGSVGHEVIVLDDD